MLHLYEGNSRLAKKTFFIPDGIRDYLSNILDEYNESGANKEVDGYARLYNTLQNDSIKYEEMKRIKHFFDNYNGTRSSTEYKLNGGDIMKDWVNNQLATATKVIRDEKETKKAMGMKNVYRKSHTKDKGLKSKHKPTKPTFDTKGSYGDKIKNHSNLKYI